MTVIAYRDGVLAADSLCVIGGGRGGEITKIVRNKTGDLAGAAGDAGYNYAFQRWFVSGEKGKPPVAKADGNFIDRGVIFRRSGTIEVYEPSGMFLVRAEFFAIGCGKAEALAAMMMGADAVRAVEIAIELDVNCGGPVVVLRHEKETKMKGSKGMPQRKMMASHGCRQSTKGSRMPRKVADDMDMDMPKSMPKTQDAYLRMPRGKGPGGP